MRCCLIGAVIKQTIASPTMLLCDAPIPGAFGIWLPGGFRLGKGSTKTSAGPRVRQNHLGIAGSRDLR